MADLDRGAREDAQKALKRLKTPMLDKRAECDLYDRGNSYDGRQARRSRDS